MWEIKKIVSKGDYLYGICREHPNSTANGYVLLHRLVMENHLGRLLTDDEIVHHKDENKRNNDINNLEVMSRSKHTILHRKTGRNIVELVCPNCHGKFHREKRNVVNRANQIGIYCSRSCSAKKTIERGGFRGKRK